jgi:hypothetical protein
MDYSSIVEKYDQEKKDMIVSFAELNRDKMHLYNEYHSAALNKFFELWVQEFPNIKQSKSCTGCRKSVCHFFHSVADFISKEEEIVPETVKVKSKKKKKVLSKK